MTCFRTPLVIVFISNTGGLVQNSAVGFCVGLRWQIVQGFSVGFALGCVGYVRWLCVGWFGIRLSIWHVCEDSILPNSGKLCVRLSVTFPLASVGSSVGRCCAGKGVRPAMFRMQPSLSAYALASLNTCFCVGFALGCVGFVRWVCVGFGFHRYFRCFVVFEIRHIILLLQQEN